MSVMNLFIGAPTFGVDSAILYLGQFGTFQNVAAGPGTQLVLVADNLTLILTGTGLDATGPRTIASGGTVTGVSILLNGAAAVSQGSFVTPPGTATFQQFLNSPTIANAIPFFLAEAVTVNGSAGHDAIFGSQFNDTLLGGGGDDYFVPTLGNDTVDGGDGNDMLGYYSEAGTRGVIVNLSASTVSADVGFGTQSVAAGTARDTWGTLDTISNVEDVRGTDRRDIIHGSAGANNLDGRGGNDTIYGGGGGDYLDGNAGNDLLYGEAGDDGLEGEAGNDLLDGGDGIDRVHYNVEFGTRGVIVNISTAAYTGNIGYGATTVAAGTARDTFGDLDTLVSIENIRGTARMDILVGNAGANNLLGFEGNDTLIGNGGLDYYEGGLGNDTYVLGANAVATGAVVDIGGVDTITSTISRSLASYSGIENLTLTGTANVNATGDAGVNVLVGNAGNNVLKGGSGADKLYGGAGNDIYDVGGDKSDLISDSAGIDTINTGVTWSLVAYTDIERLFLTGTANINGTGNNLNNNIIGNAGNNILNGGIGNDSIQGNAGADTLTGGAGADYFVYLKATDSNATGYDTITDFKDNGADKIKLTDVYGGTLTFLGAASSFTGIGQVRLAQSGADVNVAINLDANNSTYEMLIKLTGTTLAQVASTDFLL